MTASACRVSARCTARAPSALRDVLRAPPGRAAAPAYGWRADAYRPGNVSAFSAFFYVQALFFRLLVVRL